MRWMRAWLRHWHRYVCECVCAFVPACMPACVGQQANAADCKLVVLNLMGPCCMKADQVVGQVVQQHALRLWLLT